jgi:hypothetical protein
MKLAEVVADKFVEPPVLLHTEDGDALTGVGAGGATHCAVARAEIRIPKERSKGLFMFLCLKREDNQLP